MYYLCLCVVYEARPTTTMRKTFVQEVCHKKIMVISNYNFEFLTPHFCKWQATYMAHCDKRAFPQVGLIWPYNIFASSIYLCTWASTWKSSPHWSHIKNECRHKLCSTPLVCGPRGFQRNRHWTRRSRVHTLGYLGQRISQWSRSFVIHFPLGTRVCGSCIHKVLRLQD